MVKDFTSIHDCSDFFKDVTHTFCALGTTRAKAGSAEAFKRVDYDLALECAKVVKSAGCKYFGLVSSEGADPDSWFLYSQVKGQLEQSIKVLHAFKHYLLVRILDLGGLWYSGLVYCCAKGVNLGRWSGLHKGSLQCWIG